MDDVVAPPQKRVGRFPALNVALFVATIATTLWAGFYQSPLAALGPTLGRVIRGGLPFAASLVAILLTHEMGHYVLARRHGVDTTLPYFIPLPFGPFGFGTLGAVIRIRSALPSRRATLEIGAAGPIAGFVVALPLLCWGILHSEIHRLAAPMAAPSPSSPFALLRAWLEGAPPAPEPTAMYYGDSLVTWLAQRILVGPPEQFVIAANPVWLAAWIGLLVTALNLVPLGQLDGGHVLYALLGRRRARLFAELVSAGLLLAGLFLSWNWLIWWVITRALVGTGHPPALVEEPLSPGRKALAAFSLLLFLATFVPVPIAF
jgi:membrane-associated protease RseP (regulator of RpoE activity)